MVSILPSVVVLGITAAAALYLALTNKSVDGRDEERSSAARALMIATGIQAAHFAEEALTGFPERLGALLGLPAMPFSWFIAFNVFLLAAWLASIPGIRLAKTAAYFAAWFLAIAGIINGLAHPLLAVASGGYFPGLATAPIICGAAIWLGSWLRQATRTGE